MRCRTVIDIDHGHYQDPWRGPRPMTEVPWLHEACLVKDSRLGAWTVIGERAEILRCEIDDYSYVMEDTRIFNAAIGRFGNIAAQVRINPTNHPMSRASLHHFTYRPVAHFMAEADETEVADWRLRHKVTVGHDVWIGHGAIVLPGVSVGLGAIVGVGSVVTKPVPDFTIVAGNPARMIRRRVSEHVEAALKRIAWWDWPRERLIERLSDFQTLDAPTFAARYDPQARADRPASAGAG